MHFSMKSVVVSALVVAAMSTINPALAGSKGGGGSGGDASGAIAYDDDTGDYGLTYNYPSRASAERDAKEDCGNRNCKIAVWFKNQCGAVAEAKTVWGYGLGTSRKEAKKDALSMCGKGSCEIVAWACTDR
jgi:serine/threonine-protein kinase